MASENEDKSDSFLPTLNDDADAETTIRGLIPWLENPKQCDCGEYCIATTGYVGDQAMYMDIWQCEDCGNRYYRDSNS